MRTVSLHESKIRASLLLKALRATDAGQARAAAERLRIVPAFARLSADQLVARRDEVQRKHALAAVAHEEGFASWAELKQAHDSAPRAFDPEALFETAGSGGFLNRWFTTWDEANASRQRDGGFLFPYRHQFFVCEAAFLARLKIDVRDPDWERIGFDWARPLDSDARARLEAKLVATLRSAGGAS